MKRFIPILLAALLFVILATSVKANTQDSVKVINLTYQNQPVGKMSLVFPSNGYIREHIDFTNGWTVFLGETGTYSSSYENDTISYTSWFSHSDNWTLKRDQMFTGVVDIDEKKQVIYDIQALQAWF